MIRAGGREARLGKLTLRTGRPRSEILAWSRADRMCAFAALAVEAEEEAARWRALAGGT